MSSPRDGLSMVKNDVMFNSLFTAFPDTQRLQLHFDNSKHADFELNFNYIYIHSRNSLRIQVNLHLFTHRLSSLVNLSTRVGIPMLIGLLLMNDEAMS